MNQSQKFFRWTRCLALGIVCLLAAGGSFAIAQSTSGAEDEVSYLRVTNLTPGHVLWVRTGPSIRSQRIGFFRYNERYIRSYGCKTFRVTWCEVEYHGTRGWASKLYLTEDMSRVATFDQEGRALLPHIAQVGQSEGRGGVTAIWLAGPTGHMRT